LLRLAASAGGNPLFLTELVDALIRGGALTVDHGNVDVVSGRMPDSLSAAITDRLEFLSTPTREMLRIAALLGVGFSLSDLAVVLGRRAGELLPVLDEAVLAGILRDDGHELAFRHPLIQAGLYESMPAAIRGAWHRDAARALAENGASPERVARQLLPALAAQSRPEQLDEWLVQWLAGAAHQLVGHAPSAVIPLLRWAIAGTPASEIREQLTCRLADALYRVGDATDAAHIATEALTRAASPDLLVDLHWTLTQARMLEGRSEESIAALERALESPGVEPRHRARLLVLIARAHRSLGRVSTAGQVAESALTMATAVGDRWAIGWALVVLAQVHGMRGEAVRALPLFDHAMAAAEGDPTLTDQRLALQINQAAALGDLDRYEEAIIAAQQVRQLAGEAGNLVRLAQAQSVLAELLFDVGRWDDALAELDLGSSMSKDPDRECSDRGLFATIQLHRRDDAATQYLVDAERYASRLGDRLVGSLLLARSLDREQADAPAEALAILLTPLSETVEQVSETAELLVDAVRLAITVGDQSVAHAIVQHADTMAHASEVTHQQAVALHCRGLLENDPAQLLRAADRYRVAGRQLPLAQALEAAGVATAEQGNISGARAHFTDASTLYSALGANWDLRRTQVEGRKYGIRTRPRIRHLARTNLQAEAPD